MKNLLANLEKSDLILGYAWNHFAKLILYFHRRNIFSTSSKKFNKRRKYKQEHLDKEGGELLMKTMEPGRNIKGVVFDILRCSLNDGPGIRTTIFLKGCYLRCIWCHNPESHEFLPELMYFEERCIKCRSCVKICKNMALEFRKDKLFYYQQKCSKCFRCVNICPANALIKKGMEISVGEIIEIVKKDIDYYNKSNGGITVSGGEPLAQPNFVYHLCKECKEYGISTCIETSGFGKREHFEKIAEVVDLFLFDYKASKEKHKILTGVDNDLILSNLELLDALKAKIILRCPLVPQINDEPEHLKEIGLLSRKYKSIIEIDVLPYHDIGLSKIKRIFKEDYQKKFEIPDKVTIQKWKNEIEKWAECEVKIS